ncbi:MAG TPA: IS5 family transposase [Anaerolineales bacterium]|nr:IS5 family transposase [Anaerolineales bacterium]
MAGETGKASRGCARKVVRLEKYSKSTPSRRTGSKATAIGGGRLLSRLGAAGVFKRMWQAGLLEYDELQGIDWQWQAADGALTKAPLGGEKTGPNPTDRGKSGTKRSLLVNGQGLPLGLVASGANTPDGKLLETTLLAIPVSRPDPEMVEQHLSLDKGYSGEPCATTAQTHSYRLHVPDKANAKKRKRQPGRRKPRRWIVEVAHSWINRFRRLLVRWEKKASNYLSLLYFACAIICWRKCEV